MEIGPQLLFGDVMHQRLFPRRNGFRYGIYYIACPLSLLDEMNDGWRFGVNRPALMGFYNKDHGARDGGDLHLWAKKILGMHGIQDADGEIILLAMPRVFGHVFNPVSFWFCHSKTGHLRAVICEVNNTFGETHSYVCLPSADGFISAEMPVTAEKVFHVSPFLEREGEYRFRFSLEGNKVDIWIDFYDAEQRKKLVTALSGALQPMTRASCRRAFWRYPLVSLVALWRIHWHALRLLFKGVRYVPKPLQNREKVTVSTNINKM